MNRGVPNLVRLLSRKYLSVELIIIVSRVVSIMSRNRFRSDLVFLDQILKGCESGTPKFILTREY